LQKSISLFLISLIKRYFLAISYVAISKRIIGVVVLNRLSLILLFLLSILLVQSKISTDHLAEVVIVFDGPEGQ